MKNILFSPPDISNEEIEEVIDSLKSGWITTGLKTKRFEKEISRYCNTETAVCLNSQTACAELTLRILGVGPGDEVIVPAYTYSASCSVICHVGATPVMVDCAPGQYEMDYNKLESCITSKTKVIIPVDIAGILCDYDKIYEIVEKKKNLFSPSSSMQKLFNRIIIMSDAAHSFGACKHNNLSGTFADFTCFSFHAVKNLTTAEGGAVTWRSNPQLNNYGLYTQYQLLSLHGQTKDALAKTQLGAWEYDIIEPYYKCNMTDIMAALGLAQLRRYTAMLNRRHEIIEKYNKGLKNLPIQVLMHRNGNTLSSGHLYLVNLLNKDEKYRNCFITEMEKRGISCNVHYKPLPMFTAYKKLGFDIKNFPNAYNQYRNEITLPLHTKLSDEEIDYIIECFKEIMMTCDF